MLPEIQTILYATDLEPHARKVFRYAVGLADRYGARIVLLHALEPLGPTAKALVNSILPEEKAEQLQREGFTRLHELIRERLETFRTEELDAEAKDVELVSEVRIVEGFPAKVIVKEAETIGADLIVMGTHGHAGLGEIVLGSVAHRVLQNSRIPVLLKPLRDG